LLPLLIIQRFELLFQGDAPHSALDDCDQSTVLRNSPDFGQGESSGGAIQIGVKVVQCLEKGQTAAVSVEFQDAVFIVIIDLSLGADCDGLHIIQVVGSENSLPRFS